MPSSPAFRKHYRKLNSAQKQAVDAIEGPVMVVAGPGTGKTQILTVRIANILQRTDTTPDSILALTFTEAGVVAMRKRLVEIMGSDAYRVGIYTFHGFANDLIQRYPDRYPRIIGAQNINDIDKITLLRSIIQSTKLTRLKPFGDPFYYVHAIRSGISELKRENISPKQARAKVTKEKKAFKRIDDLYHAKGVHKGKMKGKYSALEKQIEKNEELVVVYDLYEKELHAKRWYDYDDMILETIRGLEKNKEFLLELQEQYHYILADEHQDANNSQNRLLELLSSFHASPNLFLVGDEKQAIYRFQGASLLNFRRFIDAYPKAEVIHLRENYRSNQMILDAAHSLIQKGPLGGFEHNAPLKSHSKSKRGGVEMRSFSRPEFEYAYIAQAIGRLIEEGVDAPEIAVLYRTNSDVEALLPALERERVPYVIESDQNVLSDEDIRKFISLLYAVHFFGSEERLVAVLYIDFLEISPLDIYRLLKYKNRERISLYDLIQSPPHLRKAGVRKTKAIRDLYRKLTSWSAFSRNHSILETIETIARESGFWGHIIVHTRAQEKLDKYAGFVRDIEELVESHREYSLEDLIEYLTLVKEHNLLVKRARRYTRAPSIRLMTVHKAKGLEFDYVFMPGVNDARWGSQRSITHFNLAKEEGNEQHDTLSDERRLFYVALTRARHAVMMSYAKEGKDGKEQLPSQFLEEIDSAFLTEKAMNTFEAKEKPQKMLSPQTPMELPVTEARYLKELFLEQGLSVTALNNYLRSPWEYFFGNLLRVPKAPTKSMLYGTAVHGALRDYSEHIEQGHKATKAYLLARFRHHLKRAPLSLYEYEESQKKGEYALSGYYDTYSKQHPPSVGNELSISMQLALGNGESIRLRGILDRVETLEGNQVRVIDYKTGPIQSRNSILGETKTSAGDYWRQLVFYKLLLSSRENTPYEMTSGMIDFVEPDTRGRYRREEFTVTTEDVHTLRALIERVVNEIMELSFWNTSCDPKKSTFCNLYELLKR